jgi:leader peptidase (prepilin peptidase) / N-methyltransferase
VGLSGLFGVLFGSFANVLIHRIPAGMSIASPPSACPSCGTQIKPYDNIPIVSWLVLRGRCRACSASISARYPLVELGMGVLLAVTALTADRLSDLVVTLPLVFLASTLAVIDLDTKRLPDPLTLPLLVAMPAAGGIAVALGSPGEAWIRAAVTALAAGAVFLVIALVAPAGIGLGDVKLAPSLGFAMGFLERGGARAFLGFLLAFLLGAVIGVALMLTKRAGRKTKIPFGPFLVAGSLISIWWGEGLVRLWLGS